MSEVVEFLKMQNERLKFYNADFWETTKFFSGILTLLLSIPVGLWFKEDRPEWWSLVAAWAPLMGFLVSLACCRVLRRGAEGYYAAAASVIFMERMLGLHERNEAGRMQVLVEKRRLARGQKTVEDLYTLFLKRLEWFRGWGRMGVVLKLFLMYAIFSGIETAVLFVHGLFGVNLIAWVRGLATGGA